MNDEKKSVSVKIKVTGRVQRVGYRYFVHHWAEDFGIGGWVKNQRDGSVFLKAEGRKDRIEKLIKELKEGPSMAQVEDVNVKWAGFENKYRNFDVRY